MIRESFVLYIDILIFIRLLTIPAFSYGLPADEITGVGMVNAVVGKATVARTGGPGNVPLKFGETLKSQDEIILGEDSRIEILLNPGTWLRLGPNTRIRIVNVALPDPELELTAGTIVFESINVFLDSPNMPRVRTKIKTPHHSLRMEEEGFYRVTVVEGSFSLEVHEGQMALDDPSGWIEHFESGVSANQTKGQALHVKPLAIKPDDLFEQWCSGRTKTLRGANYKLTGQYTQQTLDPKTGWVYSPEFHLYTFVPGRTLTKDTESLHGFRGLPTTRK